jgi:3-oxoadipate enol-lactonase
MPFAHNDGVRLHWEETGEGTPVLLVMGHRFSGRMWYPVIPTLAERHRVIWFDHRGTGDSDAPHDATIGDLANDAWAVLDAAGVDSAHVYGVSMGGVVVEEMALARPDRVRSLIVGCSGVLTTEVPRASKYRHILYWIPFRFYEAQVRKSLYGPAADPTLVERDIEMLRGETFSPRGVIAQARALAAYSTTTDAVAGIDKPALVLHGTADATVPFASGQDLAATLPHARFVPLEGAGHSYFAAGGRRANDEVVAFLDEVDGVAR